MQGHYHKLAIANPRVAPYGMAAKETLQHLGLEQQSMSRLVTGESIGQAWQFVASGNATLGFVSLSQVIKDGNVPHGVWVVPAEFHSPIRQNAVLLRRGKHNLAAVTLLKFLQSEKAHSIILRYGYQLDTAL